MLGSFKTLVQFVGGNWHCGGDDAGFHHGFLTTPCISIVFYLKPIHCFTEVNSELSEAPCYQQNLSLGNITATSSLSLTDGNAP